MSDGGISKEAHESANMTSIANVAVVSKIIEVPETSRSIQTFKMVYDKLFQEFKAELADEYGQMRGGYMSEYQSNYDQNTARKGDKIREMLLIIQRQSEYIKELKDLKQLKMRPFMMSLFGCNTGLHTKRVVFTAMKERFEVYKRNKNLERYAVGWRHTRRLQAMFDALRKCSHDRFVKKLVEKETEFRTELESKILVQYRTKVDSLLIRAAELED